MPAVSEDQDWFVVLAYHDAADLTEALRAGHDPRAVARTYDQRRVQRRRPRRLAQPPRRPRRLCDDLRLAQLGLVDAEKSRAVCLGLYPPTVSMSAFETTLGAEAWLRAYRASTVLSAVTGAPR